MKLALVLYRYFPYGGLQRDCLAIAQAAQARGHQVTLYARQWEGPLPDILTVVILPSKGWDNTASNARFYARLQATLRQNPVDCVLGFNKMPQLDAYYAADECLAYRWARRPWWRRWGRRYAQLLGFEQAVFSPQAHTEIFLLTEVERQRYQQIYHTPTQRLHLLPPGIDANRRPTAAAPQQRVQLRATAQVGVATPVLLFLGSDFHRKGLDRVVRSLAAVAPLQPQLWVVGADNPRPYQRLAQRCNVVGQLQFWGPRNDVPALLQAADYLVHPARVENAGLVLVEALAAGLPVLTTAACGYASYVTQAQAGAVLAEPFSQDAWNNLLYQALLGEQRVVWAANARRYGAEADIYQLPQRLVQYLETRCPTRT